MTQTTINSKIIKASVDTIYKAFTNPTALEIWQALATARLHRVG